MNSTFKLAINLLLSAVFALSSIAVASAAECGLGGSAVSSGVMTMACCAQHKTPGIHAPCHCSVKSAPVSAPQTVSTTEVSNQDLPVAEVAQPKVFIGYTQEPINSQWLALDCRLRAPPLRLYIINCALLS